MKWFEKLSYNFKNRIVISFMPFMNEVKIQDIITEYFDPILIGSIFLSLFFIYRNINRFVYYLIKNMGRSNSEEKLWLLRSKLIFWFIFFIISSFIVYDIIYNTNAYLFNFNSYECKRIIKFTLVILLTLINIYMNYRIYSYKSWKTWYSISSLVATLIIISIFFYPSLFVIIPNTLIMMSTIISTWASIANFGNFHYLGGTWINNENVIKIYKNDENIMYMRDSDNNESNSNALPNNTRGNNDVHDNTSDNEATVVDSSSESDESDESDNNSVNHSDLEELSVNELKEKAEKLKSIKEGIEKDIEVDQKMLDTLKSYSKEKVKAIITHHKNLIDRVEEGKLDVVQVSEGRCRNIDELKALAEQDKIIAMDRYMSMNAKDIKNVIEGRNENKALFESRLNEVNAKINERNNNNNNNNEN
jgi:hypothetical protein